MEERTGWGTASGVLFGRSADRMARLGKVICRVAGPTSLPDRQSGALLTD